MKKIIVLLIGLVLVTGCGCTKKEETKEEKITDVKVNNNEEVVKDRELDGLSFTNTSLTSINKHWQLVTKVTNNTESDYNLNEFKIIAKDKDGNIITTLIGYVGGVIPKGQTREIETGTYVDLTKATSIEYEVVK